MFKRIIPILAFVPLMIIGFLLYPLSAAVAVIFKGEPLFKAESNLHLALRKLKHRDFSTPAVAKMRSYLKKIEIKGFALVAGSSF